MHTYTPPYTHFALISCYTACSFPQCADSWLLIEWNHWSCCEAPASSHHHSSSLPSRNNHSPPPPIFSSPNSTTVIHFVLAAHSEQNITMNSALSHGDILFSPLSARRSQHLTDNEHSITKLDRGYFTPQGTWCHNLAFQYKYEAEDI